MDKEIVAKIKKILALADKAGTEGEAIAAMGKAQELLAKHGLDMADVKKASDELQESYERDVTEVDAGLRPWKRDIWNGLAELYFCYYYYSGTKRHTLIGKPSNVAIAKYLINYIINTGEQLAKEVPSDIMLKRDYINSFKAGFGSRIEERCFEEVRRAKESGIKDSTTGTMLMVMPLYEQTKNEIIQVKKELGLKIRTVSPQQTVRHGGGFRAGATSANKVSLSANALNGGKAARQIQG